MNYYINDVTIDNEEVLVEYGAAGTATGTYEYGLQRLSVEHVNEAKEYYLYNGTGNVVQTTAENGSAFLRYTYDPFGNVTSINAPMTVDIDDLNRYTYNGEDYDYNTGLQYLRARYYSTGTGNFISQDTYLGQTLVPLTQNRYTYTGNNPVMYDDPSGHAFLDILTMGYGLYSAYRSAVDAHDFYETNSAPLIEDLTRMAEEAKTVDTCGVEWANMPDNVIFDESTGMYLSFGCAAQAELYQQKLAMLQELKSQLYSAYAHAILDAISSIPGIGALGDIGNAILYAIEGDYANAALSGVSAIFGLDDLMKIMKNPASFLDFFKLGKKGGKAATEALGLADNADGVLNQTDELIEAAADAAKQGDAALDASKHVDDNLLDSAPDVNGKPDLSGVDDSIPAGKPDSPNRPTASAPDPKKTNDIPESSDIDGQIGEITLTKNVSEHFLKHHSSSRVQLTIDKLVEKGLGKNAEEYLGGNKTFFNPSWSEDEIVNAVSQAYSQALKDGFTGKKYETTIFGEVITLIFKEDGTLDTAFGNHTLDLSDFGY